MFERSVGGQKNRAIFLGVDFVCYVEGGGGKSEKSEDGFFWMRVFKALRPDLKIKFFARGGKPVLEKLAREVVERDISGTIVALDADYDHVDKQTIQDARVLYTYGYSWENDAFSADILPYIVELVSQSQNKLDDDIYQFLFENHAEVCKSLTWPVKADYIAFSHGRSVLPRDAPGRIIEQNKVNNAPVVRRLEVIKLCEQANQSSRPRNSINDCDARNLKDIPRFCVGHVYAFACYLLLRATVRKIKQNALASPAHVRNMAPIAFGESLSEDATSTLGKHYASLCQGI